MPNPLYLPQSAPQVFAHFRAPSSPAPPLFRKVSDTCDSSPSLPPAVPPKATPPLQAPAPLPSTGLCLSTARLAEKADLVAEADKALRKKLPPTVAPKEYQPSPPPPLNPKE